MELLKDEEIYNIFNTAKLLNRPIGVAVNQTFRSCRYSTLD